MPTIKVAEIILLAISALITAAMSIIKFINQVGKLQPKSEED